MYIFCIDMQSEATFAFVVKLNQLKPLLVLLLFGVSQAKYGLKTLMRLIRFEIFF